MRKNESGRKKGKNSGRSSHEKSEAVCTFGIASTRVIKIGCILCCAGILAVTASFGVPEFYLSGLADEEEEREYESLAAEELEEELKQAKDDIEAQNILIDRMEEQAKNLNDTMIEIQTEMGKISDQIVKKQAQVDTLNEELAEKDTLREEQYEDLKLRIQYMYENQEADFWTVTLEGRSIREILTQAEYFSQIAEYDRSKLSEYEDTVSQIAEKTEELQKEMDELEALRREQEKKEKDTIRAITEIQENMDVCKQLLEKYTDDVDEVLAKIGRREELESSIEESRSVEESMSVEESLEASREESEAESVRESVEASIAQSIEESVMQSMEQESIEASVAESVRESVEASVAQSMAQESIAESMREEESRAQESREEETRESGQEPTETDTEPETETQSEYGGESGYEVPAGYSRAELDMLATIIFLEAQGESYEAKVGVGNVVLNRMNSPYFPGSMVEVLYQSNQFAPVFTGTFAVTLAIRGANDSCYQAAIDCMNGTNTVGDKLYFKLWNQAGNEGGITIGRIYFY